MTHTKPASELEAGAITNKIPPFWTDKPEIWFFRVEAQFNISRITSAETKFNYLVSQLEPRFFENVWDIIKDPANTAKYSTAKERLLLTFQDSENVRIKRLLTGLELGDMLPSQLLRKMCSLGHPDISDKVLRTLWLEKMPESVRNIVIVSDEAEEDKPKTAITTPFGLYEFNVMSFGLRNAPSTFQRFIKEVLRGLDFVFPYLDDVLIASSSEEEHEKHVKLVFDRFQQYGLRINLAKSVMGADQVEYLGYLITSEGSRPLPEKVEVITNYKLPDTIHELRTFLGIVHFYRRYLKDAAKTQAPLHDLLKGAKKKDNRKVPWAENTVKNFEQCKSELAKAALLSFLKSGEPLSLCCDASDFAIGSVLHQLNSFALQKS
ncbi:retrovirus-related Pol polyprotein from transposon opus [Trichonephila clavata]|uniref:Retrovirus-related Pol polyprotein from transposon opus n=1 Tax=Trichonephila clavata TaxID=2740835 RepID=A0A8X6KQR6_TRICU|nr:retrovirus-related Pol polyprotein from transposon opus [Trichonephila clavata]